MTAFEKVQWEIPVESLDIQQQETWRANLSTLKTSQNITNYCHFVKAYINEEAKQELFSSTKGEENGISWK